MTSTVRRLAIVSIAAVAPLGCGGSGTDSPTSPSTSATSVLEGTVTLGSYQLAVVNFTVARSGSTSSRVDWGSAANDIDSALLRGRCSVEQVLAEAVGCTESAALAIEGSLAKPSVLSTSVQAGDHTLVLLNFGPGTETTSYRLDGSFSGTSNAAVSPARRTEMFSFTLPAGSSGVVVGPVQAGNGPVEVTLDFAGSFTILGCVGTSSACKVFGGRPSTGVFEIPSDFPAGSIQANVYFNPNVAQPQGNASGTVRFTYNPR